MQIFLVLAGMFIAFLAMASEHPKAVEKVSYAVSVSIVFMGLTLNQWSLVVGIILSILTFALNAYVKIKLLNKERKDEDI